MRESRSGSWTPDLAGEEQETLFLIAEDSLSWCVQRAGGDFPFGPYALPDKLKTVMATFVTLKKRGQLRGCIGSLEPHDPLYLSVHNNACLAALRDTRFRPVRAEELPEIELHISMLSPVEPIRSADEFVLGEHGIIIQKGPYRAVYLPEVAPEQGWTREETLTSLSTKAGLPGDAWRDGAEFSVFSSVALSKE